MGLFDAFSASDETRLANQGYDRYKNQANKSIAGYKEAGTEGQEFLNQGIKPYKGLMKAGQQGIDYYGKLVGLGGGDPSQMQNTLQNIPGYQFARDQGIDALNRTANSRGMLSSGNNTQDILRFSQGLADQNYFKYLDAVQPYFGLGQGAASGIQSGYTNKANFGRGIAQDIGNTRMNLGRMGYQNMADISAARSQAEQNMWDAILKGAEMASKVASGGLA